MSKKDLVARPAQVPSAEELDRAAAHFRQNGALCLFVGHVTNAGFSGTISFNESVFNGGEGVLVLALRDATLTIKAAGGGEWSEDILERVRERSRTIQIKETAGLRQTNSDAKELQAELSSGAKTNWGVIGAVLQGRLASKDTRSQSDESAEARERSFTRSVNDTEIQRISPETFQLRFRAEADADLVQFNPYFARIALLELPAPSEVPKDGVRVMLSSGLEELPDQVLHSLRIRSATGTWATLAPDANGRIVTEILLEKFLRPLHQARAVWPEGQESA